MRQSMITQFLRERDPKWKPVDMNGNKIEDGGNSGKKSPEDIPDFFSKVLQKLNTILIV